MTIPGSPSPEVPPMDNQEALWADLPQCLLSGQTEGYISVLGVEGEILAEHVSKLGGGCLVLEIRDQFDFYQSAKALGGEATADMAARAVGPVPIAAQLGHFVSQARLVLVSEQGQQPLPTKHLALVHEPYTQGQYLDLSKVEAVYKPPVSRK